MKNIISIIAILVVTGCTSDFQQINTNPNAPIDVQPDLLLRKVIFDYTEQMAFEGFVAGNLLGQYFTSIDFNLFDRHSLTESQFGGNPWAVIYPNLRDVNLVLTKSRESEVLAVYEGPALIMRAYMASALTDLYGDVPYRQAFNGDEGEVTPRYDEQEEIYLGEDGIIASLEDAIDILNSYTGAQQLQGDVLYGGDLTKWKDLAGSLLIKSLMRISNVVDVSAKLQSIYESGNYIQSGEGDAVFNFTSSEPNNFRMATARVGDYNLYIMSETIQDILSQYDDPRRALFYRPTANNPTIFQGLLNGPDASNLSISVADYSLSGSIFRESSGDLKGNIITAWETGFFLAEAAELGYVDASASVLYEGAIRASFAYWSLEMPDDYLSRELISYGGSNIPLEQIATQKWLNNIINGYEGWIDYRRTGYPQLKTVAASLNGNQIPVRLPYPGTEAALNSENYEEAAMRYNDNDVNARVWWNK